MKAHPTLATLALAFSAMTLLEHGASNFAMAQSTETNSGGVKFSGSTMVLPSPSGTPDLNKINFSDLFGSDAPSATTDPVTAQPTQSASATVAVPTAQATSGCTGNDCPSASFFPTVTLPQPTSSSTTTPGATSSNPALNGGQIAGIVVGASCGVALLAAVITCLLRRRRPKKFKRGRGVTLSMMESRTLPPESPSAAANYPFNAPHSAFGSNSHIIPRPDNVATVPSETVKQRRITDRQSHRSSTKYNSLAQKFKDLRASYATRNSMTSQVTAVASPDPPLTPSSYRDSVSYYSTASTAKPTPLSHPLQDTQPQRAEEATDDATNQSSSDSLPPVISHDRSRNPFVRTPTPESPTTPRIVVSSVQSNYPNWDRSPDEATFGNERPISEVSQFTTLSTLTSPGLLLDDGHRANAIRNIDDPRTNLRTATPKPYDYF